MITGSWLWAAVVGSVSPCVVIRDPLCDAPSDARCDAPSAPLAACSVWTVGSRISCSRDGPAPPRVMSRIAGGPSANKDRPTPKPRDHRGGGRGCEQQHVSMVPEPWKWLNPNSSCSTRGQTHLSPRGKASSPSNSNEDYKCRPSPSNCCTKSRPILPTPFSSQTSSETYREIVDVQFPLAEEKPLCCRRHNTQSSIHNTLGTQWFEHDSCD